ncbi:hypothetical protein ACIOVF_17335 [Pseudomonas sp. NPDC087612]|uniref:hypothetical protein n=1 Tax=Pseudomonas sp. NPDC087612 TaxID=3364441 RepID=UPI00381298D5
MVAWLKKTVHPPLLFEISQGCEKALLAEMQFIALAIMLSSPLMRPERGELKSTGSNKRRALAHVALHVRDCFNLNTPCDLHRCAIVWP